MERTKFMKSAVSALMTVSVVFLMSACTKDQAEKPKAQTTPGEQTTVNFELDASNLKMVTTRSFTPTYGTNGFAIYAFRKIDGGNDFLYEKTINLQNFSYNGATRKLSGNDELTIGTYKFLATYGLANQTTRLTGQTLNGTLLNDNLSIDYNGSGPLTEVFLPTETTVADLTTYTLGLTGTNVTVSELIKRSVSRVDVMFIKANKIGEGQYEEVAYASGDNIFNNHQLEDFRLNFTNVNNKMSMFGVNQTTARTASLPITIGNLSETLTIGTGGSTSVGELNYTNYDNIAENDIVNGSAHIFGTYLLPNNDNAKTTGLSIYFKVEGVEGRTIPVSFDADHMLPLERNKITLVKIYVLSDYSISTDVTFEVELETVWEDPNEVTGEIS